MPHTPCNLEKDFQYRTKLKKKYFYGKQFALLGFASIPSASTTDNMSLKMSFLPCSPLFLSVWFFHEVIIFCLRSKPVAMEINVRLQICYYLWLHCRMDLHKEINLRFLHQIFDEPHENRWRHFSFGLIGSKLLSLLKSMNI